MWTKSNFTITAFTYFLLALAGVVSFSLPNVAPQVHATAMADANVFRIYGVVRDFHKSDASFLTPCSAGNGHYAANLSTTLGPDGRPVFLGGGYKVAAQWRDKHTNQIAPHLYIDPNITKIRLVDACTSPKHGTVDTYNSSVGPYGGSNVGPAPTYLTGQPMPAVVVPLSVKSLANAGDVSYSGNSTISANIHCNKFTGSGNITISGDITIVCEDTFSLATNTTMAVTGNSRLSLYMLKGGSSWNHCVVGNPSKPNRTRIYNLATGSFMIHNHADVYAQIYCPNGYVELNNHGTLYGNYTGKTIAYDNHGDLHVDQATPLDYCDATVADSAGSKGAVSTGGIPSAVRFADWYNDVLGTNASITYPLVLTKDSNGVYEHLTDAFHPIDNQVFGNEGDAHNYYFTFAVTVQFTHHSCSGGFFEFQGCDDAWLFVDGQLAMDLGGIVPNTKQYVPIDRFSLVDGQKYSLHFFYAQRQPNISSFRLRTNLDLIAEAVPLSVTAMYD